MDEDRELSGHGEIRYKKIPLPFFSADLDEMPNRNIGKISDFLTHSGTVLRLIFHPASFAESL